MLDSTENSEYKPRKRTQSEDGKENGAEMEENKLMIEAEEEKVEKSWHQSACKMIWRGRRGAEAHSSSNMACVERGLLRTLNPP